MAVIFARVDERLIHGQVATAWLRKYPAQVAVVVDDASAKDPFQTMLLEMAVSGTVKCVVTTQEDAPGVLARYAKNKVFLCAASPAVFLELLRKGIEIPQINIGGIYAKEGRKQYYSTVFLDEQLKEDIIRLGEYPCRVEHRTVPQNTEVDIIRELKSHG